MDALLTFMFEADNSVYKKSNLLVVFLGLSKLLDTMNNHILLGKLDHITWEVLLSNDSVQSFQPERKMYSHAMKSGPLGV